MTTIDQRHPTSERVSATEIFRMPELDDALGTRSVAEVLKANLENAEAQLRLEQRRARRAQRRVHDLGRAVESWHELIEEYERPTRRSAADHRN